MSDSDVAEQPLVREYTEERTHTGPDGTHTEVVRGIETVPIPAPAFVPGKRSDEQLFCDLVAYFSCKDPAPCRDVMAIPDPKRHLGSFFESKVLNDVYGESSVSSANATVAYVLNRRGDIDYRHESDCAPKVPG